MALAKLEIEQINVHATMSPTNNSQNPAINGIINASLARDSPKSASPDYSNLSEIPALRISASFRNKTAVDHRPTESQQDTSPANLAPPLMPSISKRYAQKEAVKPPEEPELMPALNPSVSKRGMTIGHDASPSLTSIGGLNAKPAAEQERVSSSRNSSNRFLSFMKEKLSKPFDFQSALVSREAPSHMQAKALVSSSCMYSLLPFNFIVISI